VTAINWERISEEVLSFMFMIFVVVMGVGWTVEWRGEAVLVVVGWGGEDEGVLKWTVRRAGPVCEVVRVMVMGMAGLWYFRRGRQSCQNFLERRH
jgi:hypothetical protein